MLTGPPPKFHGTRDILLRQAIHILALDAARGEGLRAVLHFGGMSAAGN